jgi:hypothetical protein
MQKNIVFQGRYLAAHGSKNERSPVHKERRTMKPTQVNRAAEFALNPKIGRLMARAKNG